MTAVRSMPSQPHRVFLVGCPRSGTTLLQSLLFAHPDVVSFPETHYMRTVVPKWVRFGGWRARAGLPLPGARSALDDLAVLGLLPQRPPRHRGPFTVRGYLRLLTSSLDAAARRAGATHWLEKTPDHLHYIKDMRRHIPGASVIHMLRSGEAVIASLREVGRSRPDVWQIPDGATELAQIWRRDVRRSARYVDCDDGHLFVSYERLVRQPAIVLEGLCSALRLSTAGGQVETMLSTHPERARDTNAYVRSAPQGAERGAEPWKQRRDGSIGEAEPGKFERLFTPAEQEQVRRIVRAEDSVLLRFSFI
jgi:hypothetical protein